MSAAREMENDCAIFDTDGENWPIAVGNLCVQLVSIPRKIFDQLQDDTAPIRDIVQDIQMATGAVIKAVDRETSRLTPGQPFGQQKARKEYFFRLAGSVAQVERAKEEINRSLKNNDPGERVSLKMDVSFSDHSFIIGRLGRGIQLVSHETNCLIHFPDSNKNSQYEKSNQVSISGPPEGVLEARRRIRKLLPISFAFVISDAHHHEAMGLVGPQVFETRPHVQQMINILQNEHRITITMLPMHSLQSSAALVTVRGRHANIDRIKEGIHKLMAFLVPDNPHLSVYVGIEVSPHHLDFVTGPEGIKLIELMRETHTTIEIPEIPDRRQSIPTVRIVGQVLNVYEAWVKFMDLLPLALLVEIPATDDASQELPLMISAENAWSVGEDSSISLTEESAFAAPSLGASKIDDVAHALNEHLEPYDITLISRQKSREIRQWWLVIKGPEKYVDIMFEIHKSLTQDDPVAHVLSYLQKIPEPPSYCFRSSGTMSPVSCSSNIDLRFRPTAASLANFWAMSTAPAAPATTSPSRQPPLASAWPLEESLSSMTSTPIKLNRPQSNPAESACLPNTYWKTPYETLPGSFLSALDDSLNLGASRSSISGFVDRDSFAASRGSNSSGGGGGGGSGGGSGSNNNTANNNSNNNNNNSNNNTGYSNFRAASSRAGPIFGASSSLSISSDQAGCSGMSGHSLLDDDILRACELGSCAGHGSFGSSGFGSAPFGSPDPFGSSKRSLYKDHMRGSLLSSFSTESDLASRPSKSLSIELDSTSPFHSNLGIPTDSGYSASKDILGDFDFESTSFKAAGDRAGDLSRYNLWGQETIRRKSFDAAPGSGRESHT